MQLHFKLYVRMWGQHRLTHSIPFWCGFNSYTPLLAKQGKSREGSQYVLTHLLKCEDGVAMGSQQGVFWYSWSHQGNWDPRLKQVSTLLDWGPHATGFPGPNFKGYFYHGIHKDARWIIFSAGGQWDQKCCLHLSVLSRHCLLFCLLNIHR